MSKTSLDTILRSDNHKSHLLLSKKINAIHFLLIFQAIQPFNKLKIQTCRRPSTYRRCNNNDIGSINKQIINTKKLILFFALRNPTRSCTILSLNTIICLTMLKRNISEFYYFRIHNIISIFRIIQRIYKHLFTRRNSRSFIISIDR